MNYYFDTSALIPAYVPERLSEKSAAVLAGSSAPYISRLTEVEFRSVLSMKVRAREMARRDADLVAQTFVRHVEAGTYVRLHITDELCDVAIAYLAKPAANLRTLDALHLACCARHGLKLLTGDIEMARSARAVGIPVDELYQ